jgi:hypothetical protein
MSKVAIVGNPSGTGVFTIQSPNTSTDRTLTLPDETGTVLSSASSTTANIPIFSVKLSANASLSSATWLVIPFDVKDVDSHSEYSSSTYQWTPQIAGWYCLNYSLVLSNIGSGVESWAQVYKNGTGIRNIMDVDMNRLWGLSGSTMVYANGSDYFDLRIYVSASSSDSMLSGESNTRFSGFLVRAD